MEPIRLDELLGRERYGALRDAIRNRLVEHKRTRRMAIGDRLSLVFEDRATVWYQIQEMLWVERITDLDAVRDEMAVYNASLPADDELSGTLFVEIEAQEDIARELHRLIGIDECLALDVAGERVPGRFEEGRQTAEKLSAVQYVRFRLDASARTAAAGGASLALLVDHEHYRVRAEAPEPVRASLAADLADPRAPEAALRRVRDGR